MNTPQFNIKMVILTVVLGLFYGGGLALEQAGIDQVKSLHAERISTIDSLTK